VSFAAITLCVVSQRVFIVVVYFVMTQSGNFWIHPRTSAVLLITTSQADYSSPSSAEVKE
jgi:hypothetical protein